VTVQLFNAIYQLPSISASVFFSQISTIDFGDYWKCNMTVQDALVSVVIPVHNGERFICRTLASVRAQTYDPIEAIVIDDGSTDRTGILVEAEVARDNRIRLFRTQRVGVAAARNFGIGKARGELIAPLDADDLWHPQKIARQVEKVRASSAKVGLVYCWSVEIDENDFVIPPLDRLESWSRPEGRVTDELAKSNFLSNASSPLIKRSCIDAIGGYDASLVPAGAADWKLYLALSECCEFAQVPDYLVGYRRSPGSISRDVTVMAQSMELVTRWLFEKWPNLPQEVRATSAYSTGIYLAYRALENGQFRAALAYRLKAYKARPAGLLERSSVEFVARLFAQMFGIRQMVRRRRRKTAVKFNGLHKALENRRN
jgi:glycosyltransferase involved in cell wall biosynthesis